jgi:hypothetical protein
MSQVMGPGRGRTTVFLVMAAISLLALAYSYRYDLGRGFSEPDDFWNVRSAQQFASHPERQLREARDARFGFRPLLRAYDCAVISLLAQNPRLLFVHNFTLFLVCVGLVFSIAYRLSSNRALSLGASVLFAFHPANVSVVSIASWGNVAFYALALLVVRLLVPIAIEENSRPARYLASAWVALVLAALLGFAYEGTLWLLLIQAPLFFRASRRTQSKAYVLLSALAVAALLGHGLLRYLLSPAVASTEVVRGSAVRYGLKTPTRFLVSLAAMYASFGMIVDPLLLFNPVSQTLPRGATGLVREPGVALSLATSILVSLAVLVWSFVVWRRRRGIDDGTAGAPLALVVMSLCSLLAQSVAALATDAYLFIGNGLWSIAAVLLLGGLTGRRRMKAHSAAVSALVAAVVLGVALTRMAGTTNRNRLLADKAKIVAHLQSELRAVARDYKGEDLYFVTAAPFRGYSIYGRKTVETLLNSPWFASVTLGRDLRVHRVALESLPHLRGASDDPRMVLLVDAEGDVSDLSEETR